MSKKVEINMNQFERMVKWGAEPPRLAQSFGISIAQARRLYKMLGAETSSILKRQDYDDKARKAEALLGQGGMTVGEAARTVGVDVQALRYRGLRSTQERHENVEVLATRNRVYEGPPTYANGRLVSTL